MLSGSVLRHPYFFLRVSQRPPMAFSATDSSSRHGRVVRRKTYQLYRELKDCMGHGLNPEEQSAAGLQLGLATDVSCGLKFLFIQLSTSTSPHRLFLAPRDDAFGFDLLRPHRPPRRPRSTVGRAADPPRDRPTSAPGASTTGRSGPEAKEYRRRRVRGCGESTGTSSTSCWIIVYLRRFCVRPLARGRSSDDCICVTMHPNGGGMRRRWDGMWSISGTKGLAIIDLVPSTARRDNPSERHGDRPSSGSGFRSPPDSGP